MVNGNILRALKEFLPALVSGGNLPQAEANNIAAGIDIFADLFDRQTVENDQEDRQHFAETAALRAFEALLPYRVPSSDENAAAWKVALAVECADAAEALAAEVWSRRPQRETLPPAKPPNDEELQQVFGVKGIGAT